jgi:hypothetical protein
VALACITTNSAELDSTPTTHVLLVLCVSILWALSTTWRSLPDEACVGNCGLPQLQSDSWQLPVQQYSPRVDHVTNKEASAIWRASSI